MDMNWSDGTLHPERIPEGPRTRIVVAADWAPIRGYEQLMIDRAEGIYGDLLPALRDGDIAVVNVECILGDVGDPITKSGPNMRGDERTAVSLAGVPFHIACLANNHTMDFGPESLRHTIDVLHDAGMETVGAGMSGEEAAEPLVIVVNGVQFAFINCGESEECRSVDGGPGAYGFDAALLEEQIRGMKERDEADAVIVIFHGGREHTPLPPPYVVRDLRRVADAGADVIVGHHPHCPQGIEVHRDVPILYSLGNFAFMQSSEAFFRHSGYFVHLDFAGDRFAGLNLTPYLIRADGMCGMNPGMADWFLQQLALVSDLIERPDDVLAAWDAFIDETGLETLMGHIEAFSQRLLAEGDPRAAAHLLNIFFTPAHSELYLRTLRRATRGLHGTAPAWARELVDRWLKLPMERVLEMHSA